MKFVLMKERRYVSHMYSHCIVVVAASQATIPSFDHFKGRVLPDENWLYKVWCQVVMAAVNRIRFDERRHGFLAVLPQTPATRVHDGYHTSVCIGQSFTVPDVRIDHISELAG